MYILQRKLVKLEFGLHGSFHGIALNLGAGIWELLSHYFGGGDEHNQLFTVTLWSEVHAVGVLFILILEFSERKETV